MLELKGISKTYRGGTFGGKKVHAVCDVSFSIGHGEVVSLIGESGSGKTTIGSMILRLIPITAGEILLDGENIEQDTGLSLKEYYRRVQGVFQEPFSSYNPIFKADRVFRNIKDSYFPEMDKEAWKEKVHLALRDVGLNPAHVLGKFPHQLSGGQLQRFLIARALLLDIDFLVADEIISMLDASTRIDVLNLLADLKARGLSILFITHDLSLAHYISERAVILYRGCVVESGTTEKIFQDPHHPYTQMLMSSVPRLDKKWGDVEVELRAKQLPVQEGCVYYGRCPVAEKACQEAPPAMVEVASGHHVACIHYDDQH